MNIFTILNGIKNTLAILFRNSKDTVVTEFLPNSDFKACNSVLYVQNCEHTTSSIVAGLNFFCESRCGSKARTIVGDALNFVWQGCEFWNTFLEMSKLI